MVSPAAFEERGELDGGGGVILGGHAAEPNEVLRLPVPDTNRVCRSAMLPARYLQGEVEVVLPTVLTVKPG